MKELLARRMQSSYFRDVSRLYMRFMGRRAVAVGLLQRVSVSIEVAQVMDKI